MREGRKKEGSRRCSSVPWGTTGHRTPRGLQFSAQGPSPPISDSGSPKGPRNLPQLAFTGNDSGSSRTRTPEQCPGHPRATPPISSPPLQSTSAIYIYFKIMYVTCGGAICIYIYIFTYIYTYMYMYLYINTCMSYFINVYTHRKTKKMHVKILKVNFLWVAKL